MKNPIDIKLIKQAIEKTVLEKTGVALKISVLDESLDVAEVRGLLFPRQATPLAVFLAVERGEGKGMGVTINELCAAIFGSSKVRGFKAALSQIDSLILCNNQFEPIACVNNINSNMFRELLDDMAKSMRVKQCDLAYLKRNVRDWERFCWSIFVDPESDVSDHFLD